MLLPRVYGTTWETASQSCSREKLRQKPRKRAAQMANLRADRSTLAEPGTLSFDFTRGVHQL